MLPVAPMGNKNVILKNFGFEKVIGSRLGLELISNFSDLLELASKKNKTT